MALNVGGCFLLPGLPLKPVLLQQQRDTAKRTALARFFSIDAISMYTNIQTDHTLKVIGDFLFSKEGRNICRKELVDPSATLAALRLVMTSNVFKFGDTFWEQRSGTAMGTPPAVVYAKLYVLRSTSFSTRRWMEFQHIINDYGALRWEFTEFTKSIDFLDLTLSLTDDGRVTTSLYEKSLNLYLYLPPHSAHACGVLSGHINTFFYRLCARGHTLANLCNDFSKRQFSECCKGG